MALHFPNQSRSYDSRRRAVRFWGHDGAMEAAFFVTEEALKRLQPGMLGEAGLLGAFDANRRLIYAAAAKVYARGPRGSYDLEKRRLLNATAVPSENSDSRIPMV